MYLGELPPPPPLPTILTLAPHPPHATTPTPPAIAPPTRARLLLATHAARAAHLSPRPPARKHTHMLTPPAPPRQAISFKANATTKYKVYLTCDGKKLTTGTMNLASLPSSGRFSKFSLEIEVSLLKTGFRVRVRVRVYPARNGHRRLLPLPSPPFPSLPAPCPPHRAHAPPRLHSPRGVPTGLEGLGRPACH